MPEGRLSYIAAHMGYTPLLTFIMSLSIICLQKESTESGLCSEDKHWYISVVFFFFFFLFFFSLQRECCQNRTLVRTVPLKKKKKKQTQKKKTSVCVEVFTAHSTH